MGISRWWVYQTNINSRSLVVTLSSNYPADHDHYRRDTDTEEVCSINQTTVTIDYCNGRLMMGLTTLIANNIALGKNYTLLEHFFSTGNTEFCNRVECTGKLSLFVAVCIRFIRYKSFKGVRFCPHVNRNNYSALVALDRNGFCRQ